jgi:hypothetical protein
MVGDERDEVARHYQALVRTLVRVVSEYVDFMDDTLTSIGKEKERLLVEAASRASLAQRLEHDLSKTYQSCVLRGLDVALNSPEARLLYAASKAVGWADAPEATFESLHGWLARQLPPAGDRSEAVRWLRRAIDRAVDKDLAGAVGSLRRVRELTAETFPS